MLEFGLGLGQVRVRVRHSVVIARIKIRVEGMWYVHNSHVESQTCVYAYDGSMSAFVDKEKHTSALLPS